MALIQVAEGISINPERVDAVLVGEYDADLCVSDRVIVRMAEGKPIVIQTRSIEEAVRIHDNLVDRIGAAPAGTAGEAERT